MCKDMEQRFLRVNQAAQFLGVSRWTIHRLVKDQGIPFVPIRGRIIFDKEDLIQWTQKLKVPARPVLNCRVEKRMVV